MKARALTVVLGLSLCATALGAEGPETVKLRVSPAPEPSPALRYALLPEFPEMTHGNAAAGYCKAAMMVREIPNADDTASETADLLYQEMEELDVDRARLMVKVYENVIHYAEMAARRYPADWDLPLREGFAMLLPELAQMRAMARAIALKARVEVAEGSYEKAVGTLATGMAMARDLGEARMLIHGLVSVANVQYMLDVVEDFIARPGSPNLYWALAMLPDPPVSLRRGLETERHILPIWNPALADPLEANLSAEGWADLVEEIVNLAMMGSRGRWPREVPPGTAIALATYTDAKQRVMQQHGLTAAEVERMPVLQVVAAYIMDGYRRVGDDGFKWFHVAYPAFRRRGAPVEDAVATARKRKDALLATITLPALGRAYKQQTRLQRRVNLLRAVEALRMHAAAHDGQLPASLEEADPVPVPTDPVTGRPFGYERTEDGAVISAEPLEKGWPRSGMRYGLTIEKEDTP